MGHQLTANSARRSPGWPIHHPGGTSYRGGVAHSFGAGAERSFAPGNDHCDELFGAHDAWSRCDAATRARRPGAGLVVRVGAKPATPGSTRSRATATPVRWGEGDQLTPHPGKSARKLGPGSQQGHRHDRPGSTFCRLLWCPHCPMVGCFGTEDEGQNCSSSGWAGVTKLQTLKPLIQQGGSGWARRWRALGTRPLRC